MPAPVAQLLLPESRPDGAGWEPGCRWGSRSDCPYPLRRLSELGKGFVRFAGGECCVGRAGLGGAGFPEVEEPMKRFGETVTKTVLKSSRGEPID